MSLSVGIVGLPNAGKSTLFNALASRRLAETAPRPFTTIEPHEAVVAVPDSRLEQLRKVVESEILRYKDTKILKKDSSHPVSQYPSIEIIPATVTFIDIAGLVKGAHKGEGLGNQFLAKIREVDAIVHVVRGFVNPEVLHPSPTHKLGSEEQILEDIEIVNLELTLGGIVGKPTIYVLNVEEGRLVDTSMIRAIERVKAKFGGEALLISGKLEEELIDFNFQERLEYLKEAGMKEGGLNRLIEKAYGLLGLITFYTIKGGKEVHAWSLKNGSTALDAAAQVHTDFAKNFIKAEVINVDELLSIGGWKEAKEKGKIRLEGRDYVVQNGDVIEFKVGG